MEQSPLRTLVQELPVHGTEEAYRRCAARLPAWRRRQTESFRNPTDRLQCAQAYLLLCRLLEEAAGEHVAAPVFVYGEYGKPRLVAWPQLHFNMSHCAKAVMCTLAGTVVGCDVEEIPETVDEGVLSLCFSPEEQLMIREAVSPQMEFARQWTRKEALLKLHGTGLTDHLPALMASPLARGVAFRTEVCPAGGYAYTVCSPLHATNDNECFPINAHL